MRESSPKQTSLRPADIKIALPGTLQATQNGSDLWLSYWVSHTHEERIEGTLLSTVWRNHLAAPVDALGGWQQHTPWVWMSMAGAQSAGGQVSQCCLWAHPELSGVGVEHAGNASSGGSSLLGGAGAQPSGEGGGAYPPLSLDAAGAEQEYGKDSGLRGGGLSRGLGLGEAGGSAPSTAAAGAEGSAPERGVRQRTQGVAGVAWRLWARGRLLLRELRPDVQLYLSVLLLLAAANSLFILVRHVQQQHPAQRVWTISVQFTG